MARFKTDFMVNRPDADQFIQFVTLDFLQKEGFAYVDFEGEMVWKKGTGALAAMQFIKVEHSGGQVHLEAWLRTVKLPGVYGKEMDFSGAWGFAVKQSFHSSINQLIGLLQQPQMVADGAQQAPPVQQQAQPVQQNVPPTQGIQQNDGFAQQAPPVQNAQQQAPPVQQNVPPTQGTQQNGGFAQQAPPVQQNAQQQAPIPVVVHNTSGSATLSLVMGLVSIIGLISPIVGVICAIIGISSGIKGRRSPAVGLATAGLVISIVFLVVSIINWILGAALLFSDLY